jgi:hypothetical protein
VADSAATQPILPNVFVLVRIQGTTRDAVHPFLQEMGRRRDGELQDELQVGLAAKTKHFFGEDTYQA